MKKRYKVIEEEIERLKKKGEKSYAKVYSK